MGVTERIVAIITYLSENYDFRELTEISRALKLSKSTTHRLLSSLGSLQWVIQDSQTRKYRLGNKALEVGLYMGSQLDMGVISLPYLYQLRDTTGETARLTLRVSLERVFIEQVPSTYELRYIADLGKRFPLWVGPVGKVILAHMEENAIEEVIDKFANSGEYVTASGKVIDVDGLRRELAKIRKQGFAAGIAERVAGIAVLAAPIFGYNHQVLGAISIAGPMNRFDSDRITKYSVLVCDAARNISMQMGDVREKASTAAI